MKIKSESRTDLICDSIHLIEKLNTLCICPMIYELSRTINHFSHLKISGKKTTSKNHQNFYQKKRLLIVSSVNTTHIFSMYFYFTKEIYLVPSHIKVILVIRQGKLFGLNIKFS